MHAVKQFLLGPEQELLAVSRGIEPVDQTEIRAWAAASGELVSMSPLAFSWNFHPLPTGRFCLSRTTRLLTAIAKENPARVITHGLVVDPDLLHDYSNHAIALFDHLDKLGLWSAGQEVCRQLIERSSQTEVLPVLRTLTLDGGVKSVRTAEWGKMARNVGIRRFASILEHVLTNCVTLISGTMPPGPMIGALLDSLPVGCRNEISFSTGLKFSPERMFRIVYVGNSVAEQERVRRRFHFPSLSSNSVSSMQDQLLPTLKNRWPLFLAALLERDLDGFWGEFATLDSTSSLSELSRLGRRCFQQAGLEDVYQRLRETKLNHPWNSEIYRVLQWREPNTVEAVKSVQNLIPLTEEPIPGECDASRTVKSGGVPYLGEVTPVEMDCYLSTVSEAIHGNPAAQFKLQELHQKITDRVPESEREQVSESLLREGIRCWNEQHAEGTNRSWRQVENLVDTLSTMLSLWGGED